jgi:hypothetical protein
MHVFLVFLAESAPRMREYYHEIRRVVTRRGAFDGNPSSSDFVMRNKQAAPSKSAVIRLARLPYFLHQPERKWNHADNSSNHSQSPEPQP